jgi:putative intracellular protease/amidase
MAIFRDPAMRTPGTAGLCTSPQSLVDNGLEGARASAAFGATTETAIDLLGTTREIVRGADGAADIVVAEDVAGANDH